MAKTTHRTQKTVRNAYLPEAAMVFSPLELDPTFPLEVVLDGVRDDQTVTQLHIHDALEIGFCLEGAGTFYIGPKILPFRAGDVTLITDREFHRCRSNPGTNSRWAWFFLQPARLLVPNASANFIWEPERFSGLHFENVLTPEKQPSLVVLMRQLVEEARQNDAYTTGNLRAWLVLFINELHRRFSKPAGHTRVEFSAQAVARLAPALQMIALHFHEPITIPSLAKACGMSMRNYQLQFMRLMGVSAQEHLQHSRIQAAAAMLGDEGRTITEIAYASGFNTLSCFNRAFKSAYHKSPREFRLSKHSR